MQEDIILKLVEELRVDSPRMGTRKLQVKLNKQLEATIGRDKLFSLLDRS